MAEFEVRKEIFQSLKDEAHGLYSHLTNVSLSVAGVSAGLGRIFSLFDPYVWYVLALGWFALGGCAILLSWVRWLNIENHVAALDVLDGRRGSHDAERIYRRARMLTCVALTLFSAGIMLVMGAITLAIVFGGSSR